MCPSELGKTITYYNPYLFCAYVASQIREVQAGNALDRQKVSLESPTSSQAPEIGPPAFRPAANAAAIRSRPALRQKDPPFLANRKVMKEKLKNLGQDTLPKYPKVSTCEFSENPTILWDPKMDNAMANTLQWTEIGMDWKNSRTG